MPIPPLLPGFRRLIPGGDAPELTSLPRATHRADGWPLCPSCGDDELADNDVHARTEEGGPDAPARAHAELSCYACGWRGHVPSPAVAAQNRQIITDSIRRGMDGGRVDIVVNACQTNAQTPEARAAIAQIVGVVHGVLVMAPPRWREHVMAPDNSRCTVCNVPGRYITGSGPCAGEPREDAPR